MSMGVDDFGVPAAHVELIFTTSRYGKPVIQLGRYRFNKRSDSKGLKSSWVCVKVSNGCRATITTVEDVIVKFNDNHNH
ncbi:hypothetical protein RR46_03785 [Papilio xuthus]|uniref:FLYWCH-type domain-containing protein n=1 Tax=Papilio xuthus TaxID=66420 RepID=A0A194Q7N9_PAPXU|nr:hypothetical protein RR46_03785 [Papilio xuthus]